MSTLKQFAIELPALRDEAKALWGEQEGKLVGHGRFMKQKVTKLGWQHHYIYMITSDDPVKYLKDHSKGEQ